MSEGQARDECCALRYTEIGRSCPSCQSQIVVWFEDTSGGEKFWFRCSELGELCEWEKERSNFLANESRASRKEIRETFDQHVSQQKYVVAEVAAPYATEAELIKNNAGKWKVVLDGEADIETDEVSLMVGDSDTRDFEGWYKTWYGNTETVVLPADHRLVEEYPGIVYRPADEIIAKSNLGGSNS